MKQDDIANAKEWAARTPADGEGWRPVIGRLANHVEKLEHENARVREVLAVAMEYLPHVKLEWAKAARDILSNSDYPTNR